MSRPVRPPAPGERLKRGGGWKGRAAGGWAKSAAGEMAVILSLLIVLAVVVFSPIVAGGGFHNDDWAHATTTQFADGGFVGAVRAFDWVFFRPVQAVYWPATYTAFGLNPVRHHLWLVGLGVLTSAAFYGLLRALRLRRLDAGALAALALLFPASDSTRLWLGAGAVNLSILLVLLGALLALHGLRQPGKRAAVLHAGAVVLYLLGLMTYEAVAPAILVSGLLYRLRSPWRSALPRWAVDASAAVLVLAVVTSRSFYEPQPLSALGGRAVTIAVEGLAVLGAAALPFDPSQALLAAAAVVAVLAAGAFTVGASPATRPAREEVRRWLGVAAAAALAIGVGYAMYVPADASFSPASLGQHNRVNGVAGFGYVTLTYAGIAVASVLVFGGRQRWKLWSRVGVACAAVLLALGYSPRLADDQRDWVRAAREQDRVLARLDSLLHDPPSRAGLFTVGHRVATAPGVPVFAAPWDLSGAIQLRFHDPSLTAFPMVAGSRYDCTQRGVVGRSPWTPQRQETTYGRALLLDLRRGEIARVASRSDCRAVVRRFPAPVDRDAR